MGYERVGSRWLDSHVAKGNSLYGRIPKLIVARTAVAGGSNILTADPGVAFVPN